MKYAKRYNKFTFQTNCRICLTQSVTKMVNLEQPLKGPFMPKPLVYEALEVIMSEKVNLDDKYPKTVCAVCIELIKISYDLNIQYHESQKTLRVECNKISGFNNKKVNLKESSSESKPWVEVIMGNQTFNIDELLIVEEEQESEDIFEGFLNNLGSEISASFVKKGYQKPKPTDEVPYLVVEKIDNDSKEAKPKIEDTQIDYKITYENMDDYFININTNHNDEDYMDTPVNEGILTKFSSVKDQDTLRSAMTLRYKCPYCQKPMSSLKRVKFHSINCGKNTVNARCFVCVKKFPNRRLLLKHLKAEHLEVEGKIRSFRESDKYRCKICDKTFQSNGSYFYHMRKHSGKQFPCSVCNKYFYTQSQVTSHMQCHNKEEAKVVCPVCGKAFHYQSGLYYHMKIHTNERNKQCKYCPRKFYMANSLKRHELTHTGARPYSCQYCPKRFRSIGEVNKHTLLHTGERPYMCKYCDMGFTQAHNLKMHLMTHPGEHWCELCSKGFAEKGILKFHMRNKHGMGTFEREENKQLFTKKVSTDKTEEQESELSEEKDEESDEEYFLTGDFVDEKQGSELSFLNTYEEEVLVETVEGAY